MSTKTETKTKAQLDAQVTESSKQSFPASDPPPAAKTTKKDGSDMDAVREDRSPPPFEKPAKNLTAHRDG